MPRSGHSTQSVQKFRLMLASRDWIGIDLDNTLHDYRRASREAIIKALGAASTVLDTPLQALLAQFDFVVLEKDNAFLEGRKGQEYLREILPDCALFQEST